VQQHERTFGLPARRAQLVLEHRFDTSARYFTRSFAALDPPTKDPAFGVAISL
jgi:hypothetical protein